MGSELRTNALCVLSRDGPGPIRAIKGPISKASGNDPTAKRALTRPFIQHFIILDRHQGGGGGGGRNGPFDILKSPSEDDSVIVILNKLARC